MSEEEALKIIEETKVDYKQKNRIMRGLQILAKYEQNEDCQFEHDIMYASDFGKTVAKMTKEDVAEMAVLGWFKDKECETWAHF